MPIKVTIELARATDMQYVTTTWLQTFERSEVAQHIMRDPWLRLWGRVLEPERQVGSTYYGLQKLLVRAILARPTTKVLVACVDGDPDVLAGWVCYEPGLLHYVCVKQAAKGEGIARRLLSSAGFTDVARCVYTHHTEDVDIGRVPSGWRYQRQAAFTGVVNHG